MPPRHSRWVTRSTTTSLAAPGNPTQPKPGFGPNTREIMRFKVVPATSKDAPLQINKDTDLTPDLTHFLVPPGTAVQNGVLHLPPGVKVQTVNPE